MPMRASFPILMVISAFSSGCLESAWQDVAEHFTDTATTAAVTTASTSSDTTPTTSAGSGVQTVTGLPGETTTGSDETTSSSSTTSPPEDNEPPTVKLKVEPAHLEEAGQALLLLDTDADVVKVRLSMDGEPLPELTPADFPYLAFEAFSAKDNTVDDHVFEVEVEDDGGLTASAMAKLSVTLPAPGAQKCIFDKDKENPAVVMSAMSAIVYTETAIVGVGVRDTGAGKRMAIWKLPPDHCEDPLPGWPKTIADWAEDPKLGDMLSAATAVAVDEVGNIAIGGNLLVDGKPQRYTALLTPNGGRVWEKIGLVGEEVSSVVFADDVVISGGWKFTSNDPPRTDAMIWRHKPDKTVWTTSLKAPLAVDEFDQDPNNLRSEWVRAMLIEPGTGVLVVVGERDFRPNGDVNVFKRAFIARFVPLGGPVGAPATSPGDVFEHEAMYSIVVCGDELIAGGWTRAHDDPNATPQPLFRWVSNGVWLDKKLAEPMPSTELRGAACDREGKVVGAGVRSTVGSDARVFSFADPLGPRTWYETGTAGDDEANGVACDARGFCAWPGYRTVNGKKVAIVRVHHP
jgi:hypothetical protein